MSEKNGGIDLKRIVLTLRERSMCLSEKCVLTLGAYSPREEWTCQKKKAEEEGRMQGQDKE